MEPSLTEVVSNLLQHHTGIAVDAVEDARDFLRGWRRTFRTVVSIGKPALFEFLKADSDLSGSAFLAKICAAPPKSEWLRKNLRTHYDISAAIAAVDSDLGVSLADLRTNLRAAMDHYNATLSELFLVDERMCKKVHELCAAEAQIAALDFGAEGEEAAEAAEAAEASGLGDALARFMSWMYEHKQIQEDYTHFCKLYTRWIALRSVVLCQNVAKAESDGGPICSICTQERICIALLPCGHTFCNSCGQKQRSQCYICRCSAKERHRIYFV